MLSGMMALHHAERGPLLERYPAFFDRLTESGRESEDIQAIEAEGHSADGIGLQQQFESKAAAPRDVVEVAYSVIDDGLDQCDRKTGKVKSADAYAVAVGNEACEFLQ